MCSIVCPSLATTSERVSVVLCGQEKPQLFISGKVCLVVQATVTFCTLHKMERVLAGRGSLDASCSSPTTQASAGLGTTARATGALTNYFSPREGQGAATTAPRSTLCSPDFEPGSDLLHPYCPALPVPPKPSSFPASEWFYLGISFPALCQGYSRAGECLRWGGCCPPAEERRAARTAELQRGMSSPRVDGDRKGKEGEIKPLLLVFFSALARGWRPQVHSR